MAAPAAKRARREQEPADARVCEAFLTGCPLGSRCPRVHPGEPRARRLPPLFFMNRLTQGPAAANEGALSLAQALDCPWDRAIISSMLIEPPFIARLACGRPVTLLHDHSFPCASRDRVTPVPVARVYKNRGYFHAKLCLLFVDGRGLRVVVSSANFCDGDKLDLVSQTFFVQDFPLGATASASAAGADFRDTLVDFLGCVRKQVSEAHQPLLDPAPLLAYDFSAATARLVPSVPGRHSGAKYGLARLRACTPPAAAGGAGGAGGPEEQIHVAVQSTGMGTNKPAWLEAMWVAMRVPAGARKHLVWPSMAQVQRRSLTPAADWMQWDPEHQAFNEAFGREALRLWDARQGAREAAVPHMKSLVRFATDAASGELLRVDWAYVGSHNFSISAWGEAYATKGGGKTVMYNFELGVLLRPELASGAAGVFRLGPLPDAVPADYALGAAGLPLPYKLPPAAYAPGDRPYDTTTAFAAVQYSRRLL